MVPVDDRQVGVADPGRPDADAHLLRPGHARQLVLTSALSVYTIPRSLLLCSRSTARRCVEGIRSRSRMLARH